MALWVNGVERDTDTGSVPTGMNKLSFTSGSTTHNFYGKAKCLAVFDEELTDSELRQLTS